MSFKTKDGKTHQSSVLISENGLPVDSITTISGSYVFLEGVLPLTSYSGGVITLPAGYDLTPVTVAKARYTGKYILLTKDHKIYYIDRVSIDVSAGTFLVSTSDKNQVNPITIDLSAGWTIAEADIVNRLATTSTAKIDSVEFRDLHFQMQLDGDPVTVVDGDGNPVDFSTEATQQENKAELQLINDELDTQTLQLNDVNDKLDDQTALLTHIDSDLHDVNAELDSQTNLLTSLDGKDFSTSAKQDEQSLKLEDIKTKIDLVNTNLANIEADTSDIYDATLDTNTELVEANTHLQAIQNALAAPLSISQPVITAGTENGLVGGPVHINVVNVKSQILAAHDRVQTISYVDFGTKDQRITQIAYTSPTFPSVQAVKTISYTLVGNRYRRNNITWSIL